MLDHAAAHRRPVVDPELAALIPPLRPVERDGLERSLLVEGCRDALLTWGGVLLDGHNRLRIVAELARGGMTPEQALALRQISVSLAAR